MYVKWRAEEEERHKGSLTPKNVHMYVKLKKGFIN
jgi:hypothetical protein